MTAAYVDTSAMVAVAFSEPMWEILAERMDGFSVLHSSNLLEAEVRAAFAREHIGFTRASWPESNG